MIKKSKVFILATLLLFFSIPSSVSSQNTPPPRDKQPPPPLEARLIKGSIYEVKGGSGANCGFFIGQKEVLVIDSKMNELSVRQTLAAIRKLTSKPVKYIILTHSDGDHVNGLTGFSEDVSIISHFRTRIDMEAAFKEARQKAFLPDFTFSERLNLYSGDKVIRLFHFGRAHTSGDVVVYFPDEKVAFLGDLLFLERDPLVHRHKNGSFSGLMRTLKAILELNAEIFVPGHGNPAKRKDIESLINSLEKKQSRIQSLVEKGKSLAEVKKTFGIKEDDEGGKRRWPSIVEVIYREIKEKK